MLTSDATQTAWQARAKYYLRLFVCSLRLSERLPDETPEPRVKVVSRVELEPCPVCGAKGEKLHVTTGDAPNVRLPDSTGYYVARCSSDKFYDVDVLCPLSIADHVRRATVREAAELWHSWTSIRHVRDEQRKSA
jgi:hypothetical protein